MEQAAFNFDDDQQEHLERVSSRIGAAILAFCQEHQQFHADELRKHVIAATGVTAPASADRILRDLRQKQRIDYAVVNRRESLYEVTWVEGGSRWKNGSTNQ